MRTPPPVRSWRRSSAALLASAALAYAQGNWADYGGSADSMQYSALKLLNKSNVSKLELVWFLPAPGPAGRFAFSPLVVDGVMYVVGANNAVQALKDTGSYRPVRNGPVVTAGGLIFIATAGDCMVRAYDKDNGKLLWEKEVGANPDGIPAVYAVGGRQYVAFFAGNGRSYNGSIAWKAGKPEGQGYYVYALPKN